MAEPDLRLNGSTRSKSTTISNDTDNAAAGTAKDEAIKARIIKHMNSEHADSLSLYLQHYCGLSPGASSGARLTDLTFSSLTIESSSADDAREGGGAATIPTTYDIPIEPPMAAWTDVRPRVVAMDGDARAGLGLAPLDAALHEESSSSSDVVVTAYDAPTAPVHLSMIGLIIFFFSSYVLWKRGWFLVPGSWYWRNVMEWFPGGPGAYLWLQNNLVVPAIALHGVETVWMVGRLGSHGVPRGSGLWWKWVGATFLEGFGAHQRLNAVVRRGGRHKKDELRRH